MVWWIAAGFVSFETLNRRTGYLTKGIQIRRVKSLLSQFATLGIF